MRICQGEDPTGGQSLFSGTTRIWLQLDSPLHSGLSARCPLHSLSPPHQLPPTPGCVQISPEWDLGPLPPGAGARARSAHSCPNHTSEPQTNTVAWKPHLAPASRRGIVGQEPRRVLWPPSSAQPFHFSDGKTEAQRGDESRSSSVSELGTRLGQDCPVSCTDRRWCLSKRRLSWLLPWPPGHTGLLRSPADSPAKSRQTHGVVSTRRPFPPPESVVCFWDDTPRK